MFARLGRSHLSRSYCGRAFSEPQNVGLPVQACLLSLRSGALKTDSLRRIWHAQDNLVPPPLGEAGLVRRPVSPDVTNIRFYEPLNAVNRPLTRRSLS